MHRTEDLARTGRLEGTCPATEPRHRFVPAPGGMANDSSVYGGPLALIGDLVIFVPSLDVLCAAEADTGAVRWRLELPSVAGLRKSKLGRISVTTDGLCIAPTKSHLVALDARAGAILWKSTAGKGCGPGVVCDGTVYSSGSSFVVALDAATGKQRWRHDTVFASELVTLAGGSVFVVDNGSEVRCIGASTGTLVRSYPEPRIGHAVAVDDGDMIVTTHQGIAVWSAHEPVRRWRLDPLELGGGSSVAAVSADRIVVRDYNSTNNLRAYDRRTRKTAWLYRAEVPPLGGVHAWAHHRVWGDAVVALDTCCNLHAVNLADGSLRWKLASPPGQWGNTVTPTRDYRGRLFLAGQRGWTIVESAE